jgi:hypothetical protein
MARDQRAALHGRTRRLCVPDEDSRRLVFIEIQTNDLGDQ